MTTLNLDHPVFAGAQNYARSATITPTGEQAGYDADNLKTHNYSTTWRSTNATGNKDLDFDLGSLKTDIEVVALLGAKLSNTATWRVYLDDNSGFPSPSDSGSMSAFDLSLSQPSGSDDLPSWGRPLIYYPPAGSFRYVRIRLTDASAPNSRLEAAVAIIGPAVQVSPSFSWTPRRELVGNRATGTVRRSHVFNFKNLDSIQYRRILSLSSWSGEIKRLLVIPIPNMTEYIIPHAILASQKGLIEEVANAGESWEVTLSFQEVTD